MAIFRFVFFFVIAATAFAQQIVAPTALAHKVKGMALDDAGNYESSIEEYSEAIRIQPDYALAYYDRAVVYAKLGMAEQAVADYRKAIKIDPKDYDAHYNLGTLYMKTKRYDEAANELRTAITLSPESLQARQNLGATYCYAEKHQLAVNTFEELLRLDPDWNMARPCLAKSLTALGQTQRALDVLREYLRLEPQDPDQWGAAANLWHRLGNLKDAKKALEVESALETSNHSPAWAYTRMRLANIYEEEGDVPAARKIFLNALEVVGSRPSQKKELDELQHVYKNFLANHNLEQATKRTSPGKTVPSARTAAKRAPAPAAAVTLPPNANQRWLEMEGRIGERLAQNDFNGAVEQANLRIAMARTFGPETEQLPRSLEGLALVYQMMGKLDEQENTLKQAVQESEKRFADDSVLTADLNEQLANFYVMQRNNNGLALPYYQRALQVREKNEGFGNAMTQQSATYVANSLRELRRYDEAIALVKRYLQEGEKVAGPDSFSLTQSLQSLGYLYEAKGNLAEAERSYRRNLAICEKRFGVNNPALQGSITQLAEVLKREGKNQEATTLEARRTSLSKR